MPLFVLIGHDGPDGAARRDRHRADHVAYIEALDRAGRVRLAGPIRNNAGDASTGAVIVFDADSLDDARRVVDADPYVAGGVFHSITVAPFQHVFPKQR